MHADVAHQNRILRQRGVDLVGRALRIDRRRIVGEAGRCEFLPFAAVTVDGRKPLPARRIADNFPRLELGQNLPQERPHVSHQPERHRIVARDLLRVDVHVDQLGRRNGERIALNPGRRCAVVEPHPEREQHVGLPRGVIGLIGAAA